MPHPAHRGPEGPVVEVAISFGSGGVGGRPASERKGPRRVPGLGDTLMRTMMMASGNAAEDAVAQADLVLRPDTSGAGLLEFHQIDAMREAGRTAARAALPDIVALLNRRT